MTIIIDSSKPEDIILLLKQYTNDIEVVNMTENEKDNRYKKEGELNGES